MIISFKHPQCVLSLVTKVSSSSLSFSKIPKYMYVCILYYVEKFAVPIGVMFYSNHNLTDIVAFNVKK